MHSYSPQAMQESQLPIELLDPAGKTENSKCRSKRPGVDLGKMQRGDGVLEASGEINRKQTTILKRGVSLELGPASGTRDA